MRIFYDTEFLEDGVTIMPISIGMVREDGEELYVIMADEETIARATNHAWLRANVLPHLPIKLDGPRWDWDTEHPDFQHYVLPQTAAAKVAAFVLGAPEPELWAWYGAYDHVLLAQLFGRMIDLPVGFPMHTCDLKQEADRVARIVQYGDLPTLGDGKDAHNALHDAHEVKMRAEYLDGLAALYGHV